MSGLFLVTLVAALLAGSDSLKLSGKGRGGATWNVLPGNSHAFCKVKDCSIKIISAKNIQACGTACVNRDGCKCAIYRPRDNYCGLKKYHCKSWRLGLKPDAKKAHYAIDVRPAKKSAPKHKKKSGPKKNKPAAAPAGAAGRAGAAIQAAPRGQMYRSTMTIFQGFGIPYGGCGVPMDKLVDDNGKMLPYVALNVHTKGGNFQGLFDHGNNCGRWLKITIGKPCGDGNNGGNVASCLANYNNGASDGKDGEVVYGYVSDSCADTNDWCTTDRYHVDMGKENMERLGLFNNWQNNRIEWSFLSGPPPGWSQSRDVKYYWCINSKKDWPCIIAAGLTNGISKMEAQLQDGSWRICYKNWILGQQWSLPASNTLKEIGGKWNVRTYDRDGKSYGEKLVTIPYTPAKVTRAD